MVAPQGCRRPAPAEAARAKQNPGGRQQGGSEGETAQGSPGPPDRGGAGQHERRGAGGAPDEAEEGRKAARRHLRRRVLPTFDPTDPAADAAAAAAAKDAAPGKEEQAGEDSQGNGKPQKGRRWLRRKAPLRGEPTARQRRRPADRAAGEQRATRHEQPAPPIPAPHVNGGGRAGNGARRRTTPIASRSRRELQRILDDAGLHTEVDGILADARAEAQRQGVPIDSELMLRALCEDTNGAGKLSDSAKGELESRFKRIVAEERGERGPTPGSQPPRG